PGLERLVVRWADPEGNPVQEAPVERRDRRFAVAFLELGPDLRGRAGRWKVEVLLEGDVVQRDPFELGP
ncbi:MAG: hypothetical protein ABFS46_13205, partial [Myxococcota bacterium]